MDKANIENIEAYKVINIIKDLGDTYSKEEAN